MSKLALMCLSFLSLELTPMNLPTKDLLSRELQLLFASRKNDFNAVQKLIYNDVNVHANDTGCTALHYAAQNGNLEMVQLFLFMKADINAQDLVGFAPLHTAICEGNTDVAKLLIKRRADVNLADKKNQTPLMYACATNNQDLIKKLIFYGADISKTNHQGKIASFFSPQDTQATIIALINTEHENRKSAERQFIIQCETDNLVRIRSLLTYNMDANLQSSPYGPPLYYAVKWKQYGATELLLQEKANPNTPSKPLGITPLMEAIQNSSLPIVRLLIQYGATLNGSDRCNPLVKACDRYNIAIVKELLRKGADIHIARNHSSYRDSYSILKKKLFSIAHILSQESALPENDPLAKKQLLNEWDKLRLEVCIGESCILDIPKLFSCRALIAVQRK